MCFALRCVYIVDLRSLLRPWRCLQMAYLLSIEWQYNGKVMDYTYLVGGSGHFLFPYIRNNNPN